MAENITIARPYAEAVFRLARETNTLDQWSQELSLLAQIVADQRVAQCISNPNVTRAQLEELVLGVCGEHLGAAGRNFVQVLVQYARLARMPEIRTLFEQFKLEHEGVLEANIQSAFAMDDAQKRQLVAALEVKYQRKVRAEISVDKQLIGGVKIMVGDQVLDATVRGSLESMSAALTR